MAQTWLEPCNSIIQSCAVLLDERGASLTERQRKSIEQIDAQARFVSDAVKRVEAAPDAKRQLTAEIRTPLYVARSHIALLFLDQEKSLPAFTGTQLEHLRWIKDSVETLWNEIEQILAASNNDSAES